ncbi:hypothetical protein AVEN_269055-1 [Araneus ventricosus]|uniref:Uncharacterized protein n=1 Tax=Araneus ventricosus TaxID=182803 RepID=A0A4Y2JG71_ARAVE|nr:hypothetical protein AVEN_269055-1 [Araneus ventricosus]
MEIIIFDPRSDDDTCDGTPLFKLPYHTSFPRTYVWLALNWVGRVGVDYVCTTPAEGRLATTYDLTCNKPPTRWIFSGIGFRTFRPRRRDLTTRPPRPSRMRFGIWSEH